MSLIWGKTDPFHPLVLHCIDVGILGQQLLESRYFAVIKHYLQVITEMDADQLTRFVGFLLACHDLGKCSADFQGKGEAAILAEFKQAGLELRNVPEKLRHEAMSATLMEGILDAYGNINKEAILLLSRILRGHHGNFKSRAEPENPTLVASWQPARSELVDTLHHVFNSRDLLPTIHVSNEGYAGVVLTGMLVLSDWVASNEEMYDFPAMTRGQAPIDIPRYKREATERAKMVIARLGFDRIIDWQDKHSFSEIWPGFENLRPVQHTCEKIANSSPGLAIIESSMGSGKTEAALYLASQWMESSDVAGLYMALPTAATSNQMHTRVQAFLEKHDQSLEHRVKLVHGMSWLIDGESGRHETRPKKVEGQTTPTPTHTRIDEEANTEAFVARDWFRPKKRALLIPYAVGTVDQALMSVLNVKFGFLRLLGLTGKILIIDEVHAYDPYMNCILIRLLEWMSLLKIPVILLSATLPSSRRESLVQAYLGTVEKPAGQSGAKTTLIQAPNPYPLVTTATKAGGVIQHDVHDSSKPVLVQIDKLEGKLGNVQEVAWLALSIAKQGKCTCVLCNTVKVAQSTYDSLIQAAGPLDDEDKTQDGIVIKLFHARFPAERRTEIENSVLDLFDKKSLPDRDGVILKKRPRMAILVATQVVEQSLDLDFDEMISEIAPIDLLLQRIGRVHRHDRPDRVDKDKPVFHLLLPLITNMAFGDIENVYSKYVLLRTCLVLHDKTSITIPTDIRGLVEAVYDFSRDVTVGQGWCDAGTLAMAKRDHDNDEEADRQEARQYLIPKPSERSFSLAKQQDVLYEEEDEKKVSYLHAKTRNDDDTMRCIMLDEVQYEGVLSRETQPDVEALKAIFMQSVNISRFWTSDRDNHATGNMTELPGYKPFTKGPRWMQGTWILRLSQGAWRGVTQKGKVRLITYDPKRGLDASWEK